MFPAAPEAPLLARDWIADQAARHLSRRTAEDLRLLVSELVTNSVRHSGTTHPIAVAVAINDGRMRVEVTDRGTSFHREGEAVEGGWGLVLVDRIASRWGIVQGAETRVWFELCLATT